MSAAVTPMDQELVERLLANSRPLMISVDAQRCITQVIGDSHHYGYEGLTPGRCVDEVLEFMLGLDAPARLELEFLETPSGRCAHVQVDLSTPAGRILFLEATDGRDSVRAVQQLANDKRLEHYRAQQLLGQMSDKLIQGAAAHIESANPSLSITQRIRAVIEKYVPHGNRSPGSGVNQGKDEGRQRAIAEKAAKRVAMENGLRRALRRGEFELHYQPKQNLLDGVITGCEALVRWRLPDGNLIPPTSFIPVAEQCGLIAPIGEWVLREACRQNRAWQDAGLPPMSVAVNVSSTQIRRKDFLRLIGRVLAESRLDPRCLELELTETLVMEDTDRTALLFKALINMGVRVSIDDFGTGYSSLSYLKRFPIDSLKIDQSFLRGLPADDGNVAIIQAIISMARSLKHRVVAEGVETPEQRDLLEASGCDEMQGYLLSEPLSAQEFERFLRARHRQDP